MMIKNRELKKKGGYRGCCSDFEVFEVGGIKCIEFVSRSNFKRLSRHTTNVNKTPSHTSTLIQQQRLGIILSTAVIVATSSLYITGIFHS
jgi:hypothetical protein